MTSARPGALTATEANVPKKPLYKRRGVLVPGP